ncbi:MAG: helix-turn-helix domain-containing protein [Gemmataceae bacterium]
MPRTKKNPQPQAATPQAAETNAATGEVLTLAEAAAYLRWSEQDVMALVHSQGLPGRYLLGQWRFLKSALQQWLASAEPT